MWVGTPTHIQKTLLRQLACFCSYISVYVFGLCGKQDVSWNQQHVVELVQWSVMWCLCALGRCFKVCKLSKPAACQGCAAPSLWRSGVFPSGVSRLFNQRHERGLCFRCLPPKSWSHPVTIEQTPQCCKRRGATQAWDEVRGSWLAYIHHTNPRSDYIYAEVTQTLSIIQTVYSYFMQRQKQNNFPSADGGVQIVCIISKSNSKFGLLHLLWNREGVLHLSSLKKTERKTGSTHDFKHNSPEEAEHLKAPPPNPKKMGGKKDYTSH